MTPERWGQLEALFESAVELPPGERSAFLAARCGGDDALRRELEAMIAASDSSGAAIRSVVEEAARRASAAAGGQLPDNVAAPRFGPWRVTGIAGRGGTSSVYRATRDDDRYRQQVAIKLLHGGFDSEFARARFRYERQILAQLEHPNIARLIDGGETPGSEPGSDTPYLVMEYVEGVPITDYCTKEDLTLVERLRLFRQVCAAVQHAHRSMVIHRDLKPANILVNAEGVPKLLDFGIAKMQDAELSPASIAATSASMRLMTPEYASPEQVRGAPMSAATDIYSLGAVLFEMLTGQKAHRITRSDPLEVARVVCDTGLARPSQVAPEPLARRLAGDLDNIVLKAMQKAPERRYLSVEQFSEDIRRHLEGLPVEARKDTAFYRARKYARRNRLPLAAAALAAAGLIAGLISSAVSARRAENRFQQVRTLANAFLFQFDQELRQVPGTTKAREMLVSTALQYLDSLTQDAAGDPGLQSELAQAYERIGDIQGMTGLPNLGRPDDALASYRKSLRIRRALAAAYPRNVDFGRSLAICLERQSFLQTARNDLSGARQSLLEGLQVAERNLRGRQPDAKDMRLLANGYVYLAWTEESDGKARAAVDAAHRGLDWMQRYAALDSSLRARSDLARAHGQFGRELHAAGDLEGARRNLLQEWLLRQEIAKDSPNHLENLREWEIDDLNLGMLHGDPDGASLREPAAARQYLEEAIRIGEKLLTADPNSASAKSDMPNLYGKLAGVLRDSEPAHAVELYRKALALADALPDSNSDLRQVLHARWAAAMSYAQRRTGDRLGARRTATEALAMMLRLDPDRKIPNDCRKAAEAYRAAGAAALDANDLAAARDAYSKAVAWSEIHQDRAATDLELAADLSASWEGLEECLRRTSEPAESLKLAARRSAFWQGWDSQAASSYTKWQLDRVMTNTHTAR